MFEGEYKSACRVIDANANRAAEGLRTIEDVARLVCENAVVAESMKRLRHKLQAALSSLDRLERLAARDTSTDVGTQVTTVSEASRNSWQDVVISASERVTQSMRILEEFSKLAIPDATDSIKQLRYEAYDQLALAEKLLLRRVLPDQSHLYLLIDCQKPLGEFADYVASLFEAGVDLFQIRDKRAEGLQLIEYCQAAIQAVGGERTRVIINDRIDIALAVQAGGVHLGQEDIPLATAKRLLPARISLGISTHDIQQAVLAEQSGADLIGCGPTFPSSTKSFEQFAGTGFLKQVAERIQIPAFAIGGIGLDNCEQVVAAGIRRIAVSGVIHQAQSPTRAARDLKAILTR